MTASALLFFSFPILGPRRANRFSKLTASRPGLMPENLTVNGYCKLCTSAVPHAVVQTLHEGTLAWSRNAWLHASPSQMQNERAYHRR